MTITIHGTPITPRAGLAQMAGKNFCVSFADKRDLMRGLAVFPKAIRFESADSSNVARNHWRTKGSSDAHVVAMADRIEAPIAAAAAAAPKGPTFATSNFDTSIDAWLAAYHEHEEHDDQAPELELAFAA